MGKILNVTNPHHRKIMSLDLQNWVTFMTQMCVCVCVPISTSHSIFYNLLLLSDVKVLTRNISTAQ